MSDEPKTENDGKSKSLANLKPFHKGNDPRRGKGGRPGIVKDFREYIRNRLQEETTPGSKITKLDAITAKMMDMAFKGNMKAMELAMAYGYGKPIQGMEITGKDGAPLTPIKHDFSQMSNEDLAKHIESLKQIEENLTQNDGNDGTDPDQTEHTTP